MPKFSQSFGKIILNAWWIFIKYLTQFYLTIDDPLPVLPGDEPDLGHENIVNTYLFYQVCKVHDIVCFGDQSVNAEKSRHLSFGYFFLKLVSHAVTTQDTSFRQKCLKLSKCWLCRGGKDCVKEERHLAISERFGCNWTSVPYWKIY